MDPQEEYGRAEEIRDLRVRLSPRYEEIEAERRKILKMRSTRILFLLLMLALTIAMIGISIAMGSSSMTALDAYKVLFNQLLPGTFDVPSNYEFIVVNIRAPRVLLAFFAGIILAIGGCLIQTILKNPLATPYTLGISAGAGFGATLYFIFGFSLFGGALGLIGNAFVFSLVPALIVFFAITRKKVSPVTMVLGGVAISYMFSACNTLSQYFGDSDAVKDVVFWSVGDLTSAAMWQVPYVLVTALLYFAFAMIMSRDLNIMRMGDDTAKSLGVNVETVRLVVVLVVCICTAVVVSFTGPIGFVCLLAPQISRRLVGTDLHYLVPASALVGASLLLMADVIAKTALSPIMLPVGAITALLGAPVLVYLLFVKRSGSQA